jgi:hypothetical protein
LFCHIPELEWSAYWSGPINFADLDPYAERIGRSSYKGMPDQNLGSTPRGPAKMWQNKT